MRLTATGPGGSSSHNLHLSVEAERYGFDGRVVDSDGSTPPSVDLFWLPTDTLLASVATDATGQWAVDADLDAPVEQLRLAIPAR